MLNPYRLRNTIRIGTWNTKWANPGKPKGEIIRYKLAATHCDILCVTEGFAGIFPDGGHVIDAGTDWGCPIKKGRRKVLLWSKRPWTRHIHSLGSDEFHKGRFIAGTTETASRVCLTVIGVCIPWSGSNVFYCKRDLLPWEDHKRWLAGFRKLRCRFPESRTVVLGDFNQTYPERGKGVPPIMHDALLRAFDGFQFATKGKFPGDRRAIDHIAHTPDLTGSSIKVWPECVKDDDELLIKFKQEEKIGGWPKCKRYKCADPPNLELSDHFGVWGDFS